MSLSVEFIYTWQCDLCGAYEGYTSESSVTNLPDDWVERDGRDLCKACAQKVAA